jgi:ubiquinone/menaquinone biosynthesis C-methylase UbiE
MSLAKSERSFLPAAGHDLFLPIYDPLTRILGVDRARRKLLEQAGLRPGHRVLDVGCGTGTLCVSIQQLHPFVDVIGIDPDLRALERARRKAERSGVSVRFDQGFADALGYTGQAFDRVFSSMMLHHLPADEQPRMLHEVRRVLRPGGRLELLDFAGRGSKTHGALGRLLHSHRHLAGNDEERILALMNDAGFAAAGCTGTGGSVLVRLAFFQATAGE